MPIFYTDSASFNNLTVTSSAVMSGSFIVNGNTLISGLFAISSSNINQTQPAIKVNNDGVFILGSHITTPTAVEGGIMYSGSDFFCGF